MTDTPTRSRLYPWPWAYPSILVTIAEDELRKAENERCQANYWLDASLEEEDDESDLSYSEDAPFEGLDMSSEGSASDESTSDHDSITDEDISKSELAFLRADAETGWPIEFSPSPSLKKLEEEENLTLQIAQLIAAEEAAAAAYNADEVVSLITQFYEVLITMGHWPEGSLRYPPHTNPPIDEELAVRLGYAPAAISLMQRLPYLTSNINDRDEYAILRRTQLADYTCEEHLREGRHPYPYYCIDGCPNIDPWLLPFTLPSRDGLNVLLDTRMGVVRAYYTPGWPPQGTVEWKRHGDPFGSDQEEDRATQTEYRRAPIVPTSRYFSDLVYAYRSLLRLPILDPYRNDPNEEPYPTPPAWEATLNRNEQQTLIALYRECGWPNEWRRAEFLAKWEVKKKKIEARRREAWEKDYKERHSNQISTQISSVQLE
ncbi:SWIM-type domain-containing protein [Mycena venus]|uniref:SWIM-type domain-containing protein n=1 Tax=Mycena venus TaxID=2733690 RepID=A0A8H6YMG0_9AGAR|nr:SWIM-type domain-containing protein [Mycena venus]